MGLSICHSRSVFRRLHASSLYWMLYVIWRWNIFILIVACQRYCKFRSRIRWKCTRKKASCNHLQAYYQNDTVYRSPTVSRFVRFPSKLHFDEIFSSLSKVAQSFLRSFWSHIFGTLFWLHRYAISERMFLNELNLMCSILFYIFQLALPWHC